MKTTIGGVDLTALHGLRDSGTSVSVIPQSAILGAMKGEAVGFKSFDEPKKPTLSAPAPKRGLGM